MAESEWDFDKGSMAENSNSSVTKNVSFRNFSVLMNEILQNSSVLGIFLCKG